MPAVRNQASKLNTFYRYISQMSQHIKKIMQSQLSNVSTHQENHAESYLYNIIMSKRTNKLRLSNILRQTKR